MALFKNQALIERARNTKPAALQKSVEAGLYHFTVKNVGDSTTHQDGKYIELTIRAAFDDEITGELKKAYKLNDRDQDKAASELRDFLAFVEACGFKSDDAENLEHAHFIGRQGLVGVELIEPEYGMPFNVPAFGAWWSEDHDPDLIKWHPREEATRGRRGGGFSKRR